MKSFFIPFFIFPIVLFAQQSPSGIWYLKDQTYSNQKHAYVWQRDSTATVKNNTMQFGIIHWNDSTLEMSISYTPIEQQEFSIFSQVGSASYFNHYFTLAGNELLLFSDRTKKKRVARYECKLNGTLMELKEL